MRSCLRIVATVGLLFWTGVFSSENVSGQEKKARDEPLDFQIQRETLLKHDDGEFLWFHPRVAPIPAKNQTSAVMTLQKHLRVSDYYSGLHVMYTQGAGKPWSAPTLRPELDWRAESDMVTIAVCDVTPGWHPQSGKVIAIGAKLRYNNKGHQLYDKPRSMQAAYAVYDPSSDQWSAWRMIEMPETETKFYTVTPGCAQFHVKADGTLLVPVYFNSPENPYATTVLHCAFDGTTLRYLRHGDEIALDSVRGLYEPSIAHYENRYFLTIRNDLKGYVTAGDDGLHFAPIKEWTFDDGKELGSYNTQQHWLVHSDGLFLVYTRRGADNDHIFRHRAPLFIAQVDPQNLHVIRKTERVLIPQRGATLGNFGAATIDEHESWVTVSEGVFGDARKRGAEGSTFLARIIWSKPNRVAPLAK